jgi:hypothetical protein
MLSKVTVTRISAVLFLGGLVVLLIGLTLSPRFANAGGGEVCLTGQFDGCILATDNSASFSLSFNNSIVESDGLVALLGLDNEILADCLCGGGRVTCPDVVNSSLILLGQVHNSSLSEGKIVLLGQAPIGFSCGNY